MVADPGRYAGREQAYVKHYFLESYLERLVHKTASAYQEVAYVDGFSGPWRSSDEAFEDTSFGIALKALQAAKGSWKRLGRDVRMSAYLVERSPTAYKKLQTIGDRFPEIRIRTYPADFVAIAPQLLADLPVGAFAFFFIDPKGWRIDIKQLEPLLKRNNSEVVFNFMFEFINRAASISERVTVQGLNELIPYGSWREKLQTAEPDERKEILIASFSETLSKIGDYRYVAETPIFCPLKDRTLYSLIFGTRRAPGIEVFRDCQIATLREQDATRKATKHYHTQEKSGQSEMFSAEVDVGPNDIQQYLEREERKAEQLIIELVPFSPNWIKYDALWPQVLARHAAKKSTVNAIAARLRKSGILHFENWARGKRVPDDNYRVSRQR